MKLRTAVTVLASLALGSLPACSHRQKQETAPVAATAPAAPAIPTCGGWIVVVERPLVTAGGFSADTLLRAMIDGLAAGGCTAQTAVPAGATGPILKLSIKASALGNGGVISLTATDNATGALKWRFQERVGATAEGASATSGLGQKMAGILAAG